MLTVKRAFAGKFNVMDGDVKIAGPMTKAEAEAMVATTQSPRSTFPPIPAEWPEEQRRHEYERRLNIWQREESSELNAIVERWLAGEPVALPKQFVSDADTATRLAMAIVPMIAAGREGVNRNLARNRRGAVPVAVTA